MRPILIIWFLFAALISFSQDSSEIKPSWETSGYIKELQWLRFDRNFKHADYTTLLHNRINVKWKQSEKLSGKLEVRNRFYWGDDVRLIPNFKDQLKNANEWMNLSARLIDRKNALLHSNVERLYLDYSRTRWNVRVGRQRINWGITNTWNPNDIFNTYNFLDFDYEERPGSDAIKIQHQIKDLTHVELAVAATKKKSIAALRYATNYRKYDLQIIAGLYESEMTAGLGWAGSIWEIGFKGETQLIRRLNDSLSWWHMTLEADYLFRNNWYLSSALLFNKNGLNDPVTDWSKINFQISPRNLMPAKWSFLLNGSKEFTPLFTGNLSIVYSPGVDLLILFPSFRYSLNQNMDLDLVWQSFASKMETFQAVSHTGFLRLKWNF